MLKKKQIAERDVQPSFTANREHFFRSKQKDKDTVHKQVFQNYESNASNDSYQKITTNDLLGTNVQVGAFSVVVNGGGTNDVNEEDTALPQAHPCQNPTTVTITSAQVVNDDAAGNGVIVDAIPIEGFYKTGSTLLYMLITIVVLLLLIAIIIPSVILTRQSPSMRRPTKNPTNTKPSKSPANAFLEYLSPLLTRTSRQELERSGSNQLLALDWLLNNSNFNAYSFDRKVQRFAMAVLYYSTGGTSWDSSQGWLTDNDECLWYQDEGESSCVNGTLQAISLEDNNLIGSLPNDIALLSSLTLLSFHRNQLRGSIPSEIGWCTRLTALSVSSNSLDGSIPSEIGQCTELKWLYLSNSNLTGSIPSEIGQCMELAELYLDFNALTGSIPSEVGALTNLKDLLLSENSLNGTIPESLCNQGTFTRVDENVSCSCCM
jgi:hypothetical protein